MKNIFKASAPGSIMLLGEHAVLHGRPALAAAVSQRVFATLNMRTDEEIHITSALGEHHAKLNRLGTCPALRFVLGAVERSGGNLLSGFDLDIQSEFPSNVGLGSSAAVTTAVTAVLLASQNGDCGPNSIFEQSAETVKAVQGLGSGADVAASVFGGLVVYRMQPLEIHSLKKTPPITLVYSGHKEPTVEVVRIVEEARQNEPQRFDVIFSAIEESVSNAVTAIENSDWHLLGSILDQNQEFMDAMGLSTTALAEIISALRAKPEILGAKISGSGLGDCVVGLGTTTLPDLDYEVLPVDISPEGVLISKNDN